MIVSGSVLDNEMGIIPFANVVVIDENRSTSADANGKFFITVNSPQSVLRFSHAGFDYDEISVADFLEKKYINLYPTTLPDLIIQNPHKENNTLLYVLGAITVFFVGKAIFYNNQKSK